MSSNWVTDGYLNGGQRPSRYEPTPEHWLEMQRRLGRWGKRIKWIKLGIGGLFLWANWFDWGGWHA